MARSRTHRRARQW